MGATRINNANLAWDALPEGACNCQPAGTAANNKDPEVFARMGSR